MFLSATPEKPDNLDYCLHNVIAFDSTFVDGRESLDEISRDNTQLLVNKLFSLPVKVTEDGVLAELPATPSYPLPRKLPIPKVAPKTRWQKFAEEKQIFKRKRSRKVWDDVAQDWAPRYGYKSIKKNLEAATPIVEVKEGQDPFEDPFEKRSVQKQLTNAKQRLREVRNKLEAKGKKLPRGVPNLNPDVKNRKIGKQNLKEAMLRAQLSTASYGIHDATAPGEVKLPKKAKHKVVMKPLADEQKSYVKTAKAISITS